MLARNGIVLNPHTRTMGLYGSEYCTYPLPRRIGTEKAGQFSEQCLPWGTAVAKEIGLIDDCFGETAAAFREEILGVKIAKKEIELYDKLLLAKRFHPSFKVIGTLSSRMAGGDGLNPQGIKRTKEVRHCFPFKWEGTELSLGSNAAPLWCV